MQHASDCELRIVRQGGYADGLRHYRIYVDGRHVGDIARNSVLDVRVPSGPIEITARLDWGRSRPLKIVCSPQRRSVVEVSNHWGAWLSLWAITFGMRSYLRLEQRADA